MALHNSYPTDSTGRIHHNVGGTDPYNPLSGFIDYDASPDTEHLVSPEAQEASVNPLLAEVIEARKYLNAVGEYLVHEAIDDGEPTRDILALPDYQEALARLSSAETALAATITN
jgi:hypothetical protein